MQNISPNNLGFRQVDDCCLGGVALHRSDAILHGSFAGIHLAGPDDLAVGGHQVEERLAIGGHLHLKTLVVLAVLLDRLYAVEARGLGLVALAGENDLAVGGLQVELELAVLPACDFKFTNNYQF